MDSVSEASGQLDGSRAKRRIKSRCRLVPSGIAVSTRPRSGALTELDPTVASGSLHHLIADTSSRADSPCTAIKMDKLAHAAVRSVPLQIVYFMQM